jgi:hypothetical protein
MGNDNNLLLIILIAAVLFWIFNINTTEKSKENYKEHYRQSQYESPKTPLFDNPNIDDSDLINNLYAERNKSKSKTKSKTVSSQRESYPNGINMNPEQKLLESPPNQNIKTNFQESPKPYGIDNKTSEQFGFADDSYMLLSKNSMPDERFKKVMQQETRKTLTSNDLLPKEKNPDWFQTPGDKFNLLQAVDLELPEIKIGVDTVGQSRKNASYDLRAAPQCPKFVTGPWNNSTIEPDYNIKPMC